ncbi:hypothetical protein Tco_1478522, partial [Tanacetum coccineum]
IVEIVLLYLDSGCSKHMTGHHDKLINFVSKFIRTFRFRKWGIFVFHVFTTLKDLVIIYSPLGSRGSNLYTISMADMMKSSPKPRRRNLSYGIIDLGKLQPKADIGIFIGYSPSMKAYQIYNKGTRQIMETMNIKFDELTHMAFEQLSSGPNLQGLTSGHISLGLMLNQVASTLAKPPTKNDWDLLFQPMFDEYFKNLSAASNPIPAVTLPLLDTAGVSSSSFTSIDKDAPSPSTSPNIEATNSPINSTNVEPNEEVTEFNSDTF